MAFSAERIFSSAFHKLQNAISFYHSVYLSVYVYMYIYVGGGGGGEDIGLPWNEYICTYSGHSLHLFLKQITESFSGYIVIQQS